MWAPVSDWSGPFEPQAYLGLAQTDVTDWQFVEVRDVPPGPWRSYGENNHFVIARRQFGQQKSQESGEKPK
jgi:hypothetical protein